MSIHKTRSASFEINILNESPHPHVSEKAITKVAAKILKDLGFKKATLSILLVGSGKMRTLNRKYLKHAWSTDVLAFGQGKIVKIARIKKALPENNAADFLGDVALCIPTIEDQAEEYGHTFEEELHYCLCHGILHLLGHEDKTRVGHKKMHHKQRQILARIQPKI